MRRLLEPALLLLFLPAFAGCPGEAQGTDAAAAANRSAASSEPLVVYCGRGESLVGPLLERFSRETGIEVEPRYGSTPSLASQLLSEASDSPADVILAQDSGYLGALSQGGQLEPLPEGLLAKVDPRFRDPAGRWIGTSGRARVLVYDTRALTPADLPATLEELAEPRWEGKLGWAPGNASFQAHVSFLRHTWGEEKTRAWLAGVQKNAPKVYPKNSPQVDAAAAGEIQLGWVNHYYRHRKGPDVPAANYSFRTPGDPGNVLMVSGAGIRAGSPRADVARRLLEFLVSPAAQEYFAQETFEYPTVPGVATHPDVPPLSALNLADVDQEHLADVGPTLSMLQELGLQ